MRVLILSAILACAVATPSGLRFYSAIPAVGIALPPAGDIQAAAIDAQVKAEDQARAFADKARELAEQAVENQNEGVIEANDLVKEKSEQAFWNAEEQKWQALDALKTAEAQVDGAVASNSDAIAHSAYIPYVASSAVVSGVPVINGYQLPVAPFAVTKAAEKPAETPAAAEPAKAEEKEAAVKAAEPEPAKPAEAEAEKSDSVQVESADLKAAAPEAENGLKNENPFVIQSFAQTHPAVYSPLAVAPIAPALAYSQPWISPVAYVQPGLKAVATSAIHQFQGHYGAPTVIKTQW